MRRSRTESFGYTTMNVTGGDRKPADVPTDRRQLVSGTASAPEANTTIAGTTAGTIAGPIAGQRAVPGAVQPDGQPHSAYDADLDGAAFRDPRQAVEDRVADLLKRMTLEEKLGQLGAVWLGASTTTDDLAPHQHDMTDETLDWTDVIRSGLGHLTRPFGTAPVDAVEGARSLARMQAEVVASNRFAIPAIAHEECLTGFMTWGATVFPTPLAWGATFDPGLVEAMARHVGAGMRRVGVHQGLSPVLDVTRDPRWGRTEETIGEDPYLVATLGTAYVRGLESSGIVATLKHFVGYSGSRAGRNFAPAALGRRELADVFLLPFEMAIRDGGARSVMHSYAEIDGVPAAADRWLLTTLLREAWGFEGTLVADYFGISFLERLHHVAASPAEAAGLALAAGVDVELPAVRCYGQPLLAAVRDGTVAEALVDRAASRVLRQKFELGLLDPDWTPMPAGAADAESGSIDLDPPESRAVARQLAEDSVVLLTNNGILPLRPETRVALIGPQADDVAAMLGCYSFPSHVGSQHAELPLGVEIPTLLQALRETRPHVEHVTGCGVDGGETSGIAAAVDAARRADVCVVALGDRAGLFGLGTSGEGSDAEDLRLPGIQSGLLESLMVTGTPVVLVLLAGRPYALGAYCDGLAAIVQAFFPGEEGGPAIASVLTGRVCPSGRLPVSVPRTAGGQPATYLAPVLGQRTEVSSIDPTPLFGFGHGLSYTEFAWSDVQVDGRACDGDPARPVELGTDGRVSVSLEVRNVGHRAGADVVQLYLHDPVAQVTRPVVRLVGYAKVPLEPGQACRVRFDVPADLSSFTGRDGRRLVEAGDLEIRLSTSSTEVRHTVDLRLVGPDRVVDHGRVLTSDVTVEPA
jgi:beta-xylosidase